MIIRRTWLSTTRACLKKAFRELRVSVCGRFYPNESGVASYGNRMRVKYTAKWGLQIAEMIFQTRSRYSVLSGQKKNDRYVLYAGSFKSLFAPCHLNLYIFSRHHFPDNLRRKSGLPQFSAQFFHHLSRHCKQQSA